MSKIYLDTNILVDYVRGKPSERLTRIDEMMANFLSKADVGVVSSFVLAEFRNVIRRKTLVKVAKSLPAGSELATEVKAEALAKADDEVSKVIEDLIKSRRVIQLRDPTHSATYLFTQALGIVESHRGDGWIQDWCRVCGTTPVKFVEYSAVNASDALHVASASAMNCDILATGEKSFKTLTGYLEKLEFKVIE